MAANACCQRGWSSISPATPLPDPHSLRFPVESRLRLGQDFAAVRERGETSQGRLLRVTVLRFAESQDPPRTGIITSRKVGGAVGRNRVRRRLREIFRARQHEIARGVWIVTVAKRGAAETDFTTLQDEWLRLARRLSIVPGL